MFYTNYTTYTINGTRLVICHIHTFVVIHELFIHVNNIRLKFLF